MNIAGYQLITTYIFTEPLKQFNFLKIILKPRLTITAITL